MERLANFIAHQTGKPQALPLALLGLTGWVMSGLPQDTINLGLSIVTFLMFFPVQFTQNRDTKAEHVKLDSLVDTSAADSKLVGIEKKDIKEIEHAAE